MPEKLEAVSSFLAPLFALAGATVMLLFRREIDRRRMVLAVVAGPLFAGLLTPTVIAWLQSLFIWLPGDGSVTAAIGCLIGMLAINMIAVVANVGARAEAVAPDAVFSKGDKNA